jgi:hypothetical protein
MKRPASQFGCKLLIVLGVAIVCAAVMLHLALPARYERIEIIPLVVGFAMALAGAAWLDPDRAKQTARVVTEAGEEVVHSVTELRLGTRHDGARARHPATGGFPPREGA